MGIAKNLTGKVALVTGSSRGIGAAIAIRLAEHGADIIVNYHSSPKPAQEVAEKITSLGQKAITVRADVSKKADIEQLFKEGISTFGHVDIVMSNSGIEHFDDLENVTEEAFDKVMAVNVRGQFLVAQQAYTHVSEGGRVVLTSSVSANKGFPRHSVYSASKAAIQGMIKSLAFDFAPKKITVNAVAPGGVATDMATEALKDYFPNAGKGMTEEEMQEGFAKMSPFNRPGQPNDIAGVVAFLASEESGWLTGQTFQIGGGFMMV